MSSAILYLAIVAIWAVVLVPRWLRPRSAQPQAPEQFVEQPASPLSASPLSASPLPASPLPASPLPASPLPAEPLADAQWEEQANPAPVDAPPGTEPEEPIPDLPSPAVRRADTLQARRCMLGMIAALTIGAVGLAVTGIAAPWVIIPPAMLLAGFLVLLREASHSDAERARHTALDHGAATAAVAGQEPESFRDNASAKPYQVSAESAPAAAMAADPGPPPDAEVIDISARVSDQVYDQYADAEVRAVGD